MADRNTQRTMFMVRTVGVKFCKPIKIISCGNSIILPKTKRKKGKQIKRTTDNRTKRQKHKKTNRLTNKKTPRQTDKKTNKQKDKQTKS